MKVIKVAPRQFDAGTADGAARNSEKRSPIIVEDELPPSASARGVVGGVPGGVPGGGRVV